MVAEFGASYYPTYPGPLWGGLWLPYITYLPPPFFTLFVGSMSLLKVICFDMYNTDLRDSSISKSLFHPLSLHTSLFPARVSTRSLGYFQQPKSLATRRPLHPRISCAYASHGTQNPGSALLPSLGLKALRWHVPCGMWEWGAAQ